MAFKVDVDQHAGRIVYVRVYSGSIVPGAAAYLPSAGRHERMGRLVRMRAGNKLELKEKVSAGDIVAAVGLKIARTGDTLCNS
ncbi:MAG: elongation factor G, partial [Actinobacteria bacterium]|nr:elongation factor G [Actinomycetota bacterium]